MAGKNRMIATGRCDRCDVQAPLDQGVGECQDGSFVSIYACALCGTLLNASEASCGCTVLDPEWTPEMISADELFRTTGLVLVRSPRCVHAN